MAGIAAASTGNGLGDKGAGLDSWIASGIIWAADGGAKVISMSLGGPGGCPASLQTAVDYAWRRGAAAAVGPATCSPRPPVAVNSSVSGSLLNVTVTATGVGNAIRMLSIGTASKPPTNALVNVSGGPSNVSGVLSNIIPPDVSASMQLTVRRAVPGQPTTVPLVITGGCGSGETLVGGGSAAGF